MADEERNESDEERGADTQTDADDPAAKAQASEETQDEAKEKMKDLEEGDPPKDLEDWPDDEAKYETFGGPEGPHGYHEGPEEKLGKSGVRHHEDGSVSIDGEKVENPDEFKGDPIPGGPTDPNAPDADEEEDGDSGADSDGDGDDREEQPAG